ncbi:MAG: hypothetical protein OSJ65_04700 [Bacilli bacterium]|nr:hypothetical protein [Bacilli bacterium]
MEKSDKLLIDVTKNSTDYNLVRMNSKKLTFCSDPYVLCDFAEYTKLADTKEIMTTLTNAMIRINDLVHLYEFYFLMSERNAQNFDYALVEDIIKKSKNAKIMSYCLSFTNVLDKVGMLESLYATKNAKWIERLGEEMDTSALPGYKEALDEAIYSPYFPPCLEKYQTKDISNLVELAIKERNPYIINELADYMEYLMTYRGVSGLNVNELVTPYKWAVVGNPLYQYEFAASVDTIEKTSFTTMLIEEGIAKIMYYMYEYVKGVDKLLLKSAINQTENEKYIKLVQ